MYQKAYLKNIFWVVFLAKVLIADEISTGFEDAFREAGIGYDIANGLRDEELVSRIFDYEVLVVRSATEVTRPIIEAGSGRLRLVVRAGEGVDTIDVRAATEHNIYVENVPGANTIAATEHTISLMLAIARRLIEAHYSTSDGKWNRNIEGIELYGKRLGLVGLGKVGSGVATRLKSFGMDVSAYDPFVKDEIFAGLDVNRASLEDILGRSDFISLHVPSSPENKNLLNAERIQAINLGAILINTARGDLLDYEALYEALRDRRIRGAGLDVYPQEPPNPELLKKFGELGNVILTPHLGASTEDAQRRVSVQMAEQVVAFLTKGKIRHAVNYTPIDSRLESYLMTLERVGKFIAPYLPEGLDSIIVTYSAHNIPDDVKIIGISRPILTAILSGKIENVNPMNVYEVSKAIGVKVHETIDREPPLYGNLFKIDIDYKEKGTPKKLSIAAHALTPDKPMLVSLDGYDLGFDLVDNVLMFEYEERSGVLAKLSQKVAELGINIHTNKTSQHVSGKTALTLMRIKDTIPQEKLYDMAREICAIRTYQYNFNG